MYTSSRFYFYSLNITDFVRAKQQQQSFQAVSPGSATGMSNCPMIRIKVARTSSTGLFGFFFESSEIDISAFLSFSLHPSVILLFTF